MQVNGKRNDTELNDCIEYALNLKCPPKAKQFVTAQITNIPKLSHDHYYKSSANSANWRSINIKNEFAGVIEEKDDFGEFQLFQNEDEFSDFKNYEDKPKLVCPSISNGLYSQLNNVSNVFKKSDDQCEEASSLDIKQEENDFTNFHSHLDVNQSTTFVSNPINAITNCSTTMSPYEKYENSNDFTLNMIDNNFALQNSIKNLSIKEYDEIYSTESENVSIPNNWNVGYINDNSNTITTTTNNNNNITNNLCVNNNIIDNYFNMQYNTNNTNNDKIILKAPDYSLSLEVPYPSFEQWTSILYHCRHCLEQFTKSLNSFFKYEAKTIDKIIMNQSIIQYLKRLSKLYVVTQRINQSFLHLEIQHSIIEDTLNDIAKFRQKILNFIESHKIINLANYPALFRYENYGTTFATIDKPYCKLCLLTFISALAIEKDDDTQQYCWELIRQENYNVNLQSDETDKINSCYHLSCKTYLKHIETHN